MPTNVNCIFIHCVPDNNKAKIRKVEWAQRYTDYMYKLEENSSEERIVPNV